MATELGLLSLTHLHNNLCSQSQDIQNQNQNQDQDCQLNPNPLPTNPTTITPTIAPTTSASWMWNPKGHQDATEEDSWEVRAFAEDTGNVMGTTWPPRSYTCAFCRREFRSAQALGGHMNVHRRDRARLHQVIPHHHHHHPSAAASSNMAAVGPTSSSSSFLIPTREFVANGTGLCLLYQFPNPSSGGGGGGSSSAANFATETASPPSAPSTLLSISPYPPGGMNFPAGGDGGARWGRRDQYRPIRPEERLEGSESGGGGGVEGEVDLELRLGHGPTPS